MLLELLTVIELMCGPDANQLARAVVQASPEQGAYFINGVQAQVEPVTRAWDGIPDTIEVLAYIPNPKPNSIATLTVTFEEGVKAPKPVDMPDLGDFRLECIDAQDRAYNMSFEYSNGIKVKSGPYQQITRFAGTLDGEGVELLGAIVLLTQNVASELVDVDILVHNGLADDVIGNIYFKSLTLYGSNDESFLPKADSERPCGAAFTGGYAIADDGNYFWPKQAALTRRFIMVPADTEVSAETLEYHQSFKDTAFQTNWTDSFGVVKVGIGKVTDAFTYFGSDGNEYSGQAAIKRQSLDEFAALYLALKNGTTAEWVGVNSPPFGPFHPFFLPGQGEAGGFWIRHHTGWRLCWEDQAMTYLVTAMNIERQPWNAWLASGDPKTAQHFVAEGNGTIQFDFAPFDLHVNGIPAFINAGDYNSGNADRGIEAYKPHDAAHQTRFSKPLQSLAYNNDYLAKEVLRHAAEINLLYLNLFEQIHGWGSGQNLTAMLKYVQENPHQGGIFGRKHAWPTESIASYYHIASPAWRLKVQPWTNQMAIVIVRSQMPTGWNNRLNGNEDTQVVNTAGFGPKYDIAQTFELEFESWSKRGLLVTLQPHSRLRNALNDSILRAANSFFNSDIYDGNNYRWYIVVGHSDGAAFTIDELDYDLTSGGDEIFQGWYVLNHAFLASKEMGLPSLPWLEKALTYRENAISSMAKLDQLSNWASESWNDHLSQAIGLMYSLENK